MMHWNAQLFVLFVLTDFAVNVAWPGSGHFQFDLSVIDQQFVTDFRGLDNLWVWQQHTLVGSQGLIQIKSKGLSRLEHFSFWVGELADTKLGPLQISENGNGMLVLGFDLTDNIQEFLLLCMLSVRKVQTKDVCSIQKELFDHFKGAGSWATGKEKT